MIQTCDECKTDFLTEADSYLVKVSNKGTELLCWSCTLRHVKPYVVKKTSWRKKLMKYLLLSLFLISSSVQAGITVIPAHKKKPLPDVFVFAPADSWTECNTSCVPFCGCRIVTKEGGFLKLEQWETITFREYLKRYVSKNVIYKGIQPLSHDSGCTTRIYYNYGDDK